MIRSIASFIGIRGFALLVGAGFSAIVMIAFVGDLITYFREPPAATAEHEFHKLPKEVHFASDGPFGHFDRAQLQRGFQVYKEVCAACHSLKYVSFRDLEALGYTPEQVKAFAANWPVEVPSINEETGERATRKAMPSDRFPAPYENDTAARLANNNALPPDLSLMTKARHDGGAYVYSLLTGYQEVPAELKEKFPAAVPSGSLHYNPYFANLNLSMPQPLVSDGQVTYKDGSPEPTVDQMAKDVSAFLIWTAEPKLEQRHKMGVAVLIFLAFATVLSFLSYKNIWASEKRKKA